MGHISLCVCVWRSALRAVGSAGVRRVPYTGVGAVLCCALSVVPCSHLGDSALAAGFVCPRLAQGFQCRHERGLGCQTADGKVCVMQKEFQASFWLILFFRGLLMWLDGNLHVECSLRLPEYFLKWFSKVFLKISLN